ncbi:MAG: AMP-binding protein, partial [Nitrospiria bacterium]
MARTKTAADIESVLKERRIFKPKPSFSRQAHIKSRREYDQLANRASKDPERFWASIAKELHWFKPWKKVLEWKPPFAKWFVGGKTNISYNCLDRHLMTWRKNKAALIWEGEPGDNRILTYHELHREVCKFANVLKSIGIISGDRVVIYMPMIPELPIAMLACARIGATHSVIFGGFSAEALKDRINDAKARLVITADGGYRKGTMVPLKQNVDEALKSCSSVE